MIKNTRKNRESRCIEAVNDLEYQKEIRDWIQDIELSNPFAITLTTFSNTKISHSQNFKHFMNRLNQSYLKNSYRRYNQKLTVIPIMEGSKHIQPHIHCVIDNPYPEKDAEFVRLVRQSWSKSVLGRPMIDIQPMYDQGWINYMTKLTSKSDIKDSVDWDNVHLPPAG